MPARHRRRHSFDPSSLNSSMVQLEMARSANSSENNNNNVSDRGARASPSLGVSADSADFSPPSPAVQLGETPPYLGATATARFLLGSSLAGRGSAGGGGPDSTPLLGASTGVSLSPPDMAHSSVNVNGSSAAAVAAFLRDFREVQGTDEDASSTFRDNNSLVSPPDGTGAVGGSSVANQPPQAQFVGSVDSNNGKSFDAVAAATRLPPRLGTTPPSPPTGTTATNTASSLTNRSPLQHAASAFTVVSPNSITTTPSGVVTAPVAATTTTAAFGALPPAGVTRPPGRTPPSTAFAPIATYHQQHQGTHSPDTPFPPLPPAATPREPSAWVQEQQRQQYETSRGGVLPLIVHNRSMSTGNVHQRIEGGVRTSHIAAAPPTSNTPTNSNRAASPSSRRYVSSGAASKHWTPSTGGQQGARAAASGGASQQFGSPHDSAHSNPTPHHARWDAPAFANDSPFDPRRASSAIGHNNSNPPTHHHQHVFSGAPRLSVGNNIGPMSAYQSYLSNRQEAKRGRLDSEMLRKATTAGGPALTGHSAGDLELFGGRPLPTLKRRHNSSDDLIKMTDPNAWRAVSPTSPAARRGQFNNNGAATPGGWSDMSLTPHRVSVSGAPPSGSPAHSSAGAVESSAGNMLPLMSSGGDENDKKNQEKRKRMAEIDEDEMLEKQRRNAVMTSALHNIPWLQRTVEPHSTFGGDQCAVCIAPRFWVRIDWTMRATFLSVLPAVVLSLDPNTTTYFALPSTVASFSYWISASTFGGGIREFVIVLKGSIVTLIFLMIVIAINPTARGLFVALYFLQILLIALVAESIKKTGAWCIAVFMVQLYTTPEITDYAFVRDFFVSVIIGGSMGLGAFLIPRINWSHKLAMGICSTYGGALSIVIQGVVSSYWSKTEMEREYCLIRIKQLMQVAAQCSLDLDARIDEAEYEPHSGETIAKIRCRAKFLQDMTRIVACILQLVENIAAKPEILESNLLAPFSDRIQEPLTVLVSAMDNTVLKICDFKHPITETELALFRNVREDFQERLSEIRDELILSNEAYQTEEADVFLGGFLFCIDEMAETIATFHEPTNVPSRIMEWVRSPISDLMSCYKTLRVMLTILFTEGALIRRAKEAIKLAISMTIPMLIQVFALSKEDATPVAGPAIIAFVVQRTGAESFHYASNRVLGTVMGSLLALFAVQLADGELWQLYIYLGILSLIGNFVQTSIPYTQAGNAMVFSVISIISQYNDPNAAMSRIQQNIFSITIYFAVTYLIWPIRSIEKLHLELDSAIRSYRETMYKLLGNLDAPLDDIGEVIRSAEEHWNENARRVRREESLIPPAVREPTMIGVAFPEQAWLRLTQSQQTLSSLAWMLRFAFQAFEQSTSVQPGDRSLHWVVVKHIAPQARECAELIFAACDLYLLALSHAEMVPVQHLVRLRTHMTDVYKKMISRYAEALILRLENEDGWQGGDNNSDEEGGGGAQEGGGHGTEVQQQNNSVYMTTTTTTNMKQIGVGGASPKLKPQQPAAGSPGTTTKKASDTFKLATSVPKPGAAPPVAAATAAVKANMMRNLSDVSLSPNLSMSIEPMKQTVKPRAQPPKQASTTTAFEFPSSPKPLQSPAPPAMTEMHRPSPVRLASPAAAGGVLEGPTTLAASPPPAAAKAASSPLVMTNAREAASSPVLSGTILDEVNFSITAANAQITGLLSEERPESAGANYVLRNRDIHSLEAFLFGIRASVKEIGEFQKALLEVQHAADMTKRL